MGKFLLYHNLRKSFSVDIFYYVKEIYLGFWVVEIKLRNCCSLFSEPVFMKNMSSLWDIIALFIWLTDKCLFLQICSWRCLRMLGVHSVPIAHPFICKKFVQLNIKLFNVNINFRKLIITFVWRFFVLVLFQLFWFLRYLECYCKVKEHPCLLKNFLVLNRCIEILVIYVLILYILGPLFLCISPKENT